MRVDLVGSGALKAATGELREGKLNERGRSFFRRFPVAVDSRKAAETTWFFAWFSAVARGPEARTPAPPQLVWQHTLATKSPQ